MPDVFYAMSDNSCFELRKNKIGFPEGETHRLLTDKDIPWTGLRFDYIDALRTERPLMLEYRGTLGSDPEFFFVRDGKMLYSGEVIHQDLDRVKRDGFQAELNPQSNACRESAGSNIAAALRSAKNLADSSKAEISFEVGYTAEPKLWSSIPLAIKRFGCNPTVSAYKALEKRVTGIREKFRAGGGHIHLSVSPLDEKKADTLVKLMDILAGNTFVLLDRDPANILRRKNYGRAGEYRLKSYGLEYRVLSNFWLRSYVLWSLASAQVRMAVAIYNVRKADELIGMFDMNKVRKAINENNYDLALENFMVLKKFLDDNAVVSTGISHTNVDKFISWATSKNPLDALGIRSTQDSLNNWNEKYLMGTAGFERFIKNYNK